MERFLPILLVCLSLGCSTSSNSGSLEQTGSACTTPAGCYPGVAADAGDGGTLRGTALCLDRVPGGYCTHTCTSDSDCCAVSGECKTGFPQVCSPFESTGQKMCFLSCENTVLASVDAGDSASFCATNANSAFACRSSGGGSSNRKVCVP